MVILFHLTPFDYRNYKAMRLREKMTIPDLKIWFVAVALEFFCLPTDTYTPLV